MKLFKRYLRRRRTFKELSNLSDRTLRDIGLSRCEIMNRVNSIE